MRPLEQNVARFSLKEYVASLDSGSRCFSCGCAVMCEVSDGRPGPSREGTRRLVCPACGSAVSEVSEVACTDAIGTANRAMADRTAA